MAKSLLEMMPAEERKKAIERGQKRLARVEGKSIAVSPEIYIIAEFGSYYGWEGVLAIKRGYITVDIDGKTVKEPFTLEEAMVLLEGAKKVRYSQLVENGNVTLSANTAAYSKTPGTTFNNSIKPYSDRADIKE